MANLTTLQEAQAYIEHIDNMLQLSHIYTDHLGNVVGRPKIERSRQINPELGTIVLAEYPTVGTTFTIKKKLDILSGEIDNVIDFVKVEGTPQAPNEFSIPTPLKEIKDISEHYRNLAKEVSKGVIEFLCYHKDKFDFDNKSCSSCKVPTSSNKVDTTRAGSSFKIIRKWTI